MKLTRQQPSEIVLHIMKYQQLFLGILIGIALSYCALRIVHHVQRLGGVTAAISSLDATAQADPQSKDSNEMEFSAYSLTTAAKLGQVTFSYDFVPSNESANAVMQLYIEIAGNWQEFTPSDTNGTVVLNLYKDLETTGTFTIDLPKGIYSSYRLILFNAPDGKDADFNHVIWDSAKEKHLILSPLNLTVSSSVAPINGPTLTFPPNPIEGDQDGGLTTATIPAIVKYPTTYLVEGGGFWAMAKGSGGFSQVWVDAKNATQGGTADAPYMQIPVSFVLKNLKPGIYNVQLGLFKQSFGDPLVWVWPGLDFEVGGGSWETLAPENRIPPRLQILNGHFALLTGRPYNFYADNHSGLSAVHFIRGGNYGNAVTWTLQPALDTPGYFTLLAGAGCHYIRFNFDPDKYLNQRVYQDSVDQIVQNIWAAGLYPIIAPQDLPSGSSLDERIEKGDHLLSIVATKYAGRSVWIEECNEPHEFSTWEEWKPVAERYLKTIRGIDPQAFVIVPFENYSKSGVGAAASPIADIHVDLYDGHAYIDSNAVASAYGPDIKAGLPLLIGEYGSTDPTYLHQMDSAFQSLSPSPLAISPWAFTIKGQDTLPLVLDGSTAKLQFTAAGQAIADDYESWDSGQRVH